jgi:DNA primase
MSQTTRSESAPQKEARSESQQQRTESQSQWINFKELRAKLDFAAVLKHYGVELKARGKDQQYGFCPLPDHQSQSQKRSRSFSAHLGRKIWHCFGCGKGGNALDFAIYMEGKSPKSNQDVREVALMLAERFGIRFDRRDEDQRASNGRRPSGDRGSRRPASAHDDRDRDAGDEPDQIDNGGAHEKPSEGSTHPAIVNAPLDFVLKGLTPDHAYLAERGFTLETIAHFDLGFANRGLMLGCIAIHLRDQQGQLIGYAGRLVDEGKISPRNPKYLFPSSRLRNDTVHEFHKSKFLYNGHAIKEPVRDLIVVEGFPSTWWLHQAGFSNVVALMGSSCSDEQAAIIVSLVSPSGRLWLVPDAGEAGERCAEELLFRLAPHRFSKWVRLPNEKPQPTDCSPDDLVKLLEWRVTP